LQQAVSAEPTSTIDVFNLGLAVVWGLIGVVLLIYHGLNPHDDRGRIKLIGGDLSLGWMALLIALYNVARYWSYRAAQAEKRTMAIFQARVRRAAERPREPYGDPDPNFIFTDEPPPKKDETSEPPHSS
jgi:hypothetical protein